MKLYPDDIRADALTKTLSRRAMVDVELRRVRLGRQNIALTRAYVVEHWGAYRGGVYLGYFERHGKGFRLIASHGTECPHYCESFIGDANADTTEYSAARTEVQPERMAGLHDSGIGELGSLALQTRHDAE